MPGKSVHFAETKNITIEPRMNIYKSNKKIKIERNSLKPGWSGKTSFLVLGLLYVV